MHKFGKYTLIIILINFFSFIKAQDIGKLPVLHIETENRQPVTSKTEYISGHYWLDPCGSTEFVPLGSESTPLELQIRGRGHSSWKGDKKPYKLKLADKISMLGMAKNKHWALLKPSEATVAGLKLGNLMKMAWTPDFRPVEVVMNEENLGLYFLTETIRIDKNRVNIYEQDDGETDPDLISGGWLVEIDNYKDDCQITIRENKNWNLTLKYHSPENLSEGQLEWLTREFKSINDAIYSADKTSTAWEEYIDLESMAKFFIIQEVMDNPDGFHGSFYLHKDLGEGEKWTAGPIWDLSCYNREKTDYTFRMKVHYTITPHWIGELIQYADFCNTVERIWREFYPEIIANLYSYISDTLLPLEKAWKRDAEIWNVDSYVDVEERVKTLNKALERNIDWFDSHLPVAGNTDAGIAKAEVSSDTFLTIYNLQGVFVGKFKDMEEALSRLPKGFYIVNNQKIFL